MRTRQWGLRLIGVGALICVAMSWGTHAGRLPSEGRAGGMQDPAQSGSQHSVAITVDDLPGALPGDDFAYGDLKELQKINRGIPAALRASGSAGRPAK